MLDRQYTIPRWVSLLYRYGQMYIGDRLNDSDIGKGQYIFLNALYKQDGLSQEALSHELKIDKGTTAKALKKLEEQGYVLRKIRDEDKRSYRIFLTDKALRIKEEVRQVLIDWRHILSDGLTEQEQYAALELLEKMGRNAAAYFEGNSK
ncbi:MarR family winged helix-turn-helix transcriptional regulator [Paenibacillus sp. TAB 01]|uniref:MarR family winged helix-turn-helix transcriptional regulator n=1 Tax=Paenibacillus sp. TAB 01 TaxID=3368988 RepID=UPI0037538C67